MTTPVPHPAARRDAVPRDDTWARMEKLEREAPAKMARLIAAARAEFGDAVDAAPDEPPKLAASYFALQAMLLESEATAASRRKYLASAQKCAALLRAHEAALAQAPPQADDDMPPQSKRGFVYILRAGDRIKIGFATDVDRRVSDLQRASPVTLVVLSSRAGTMADERALHKRFAEQRVHGEWFREEGAMAEFVAALNSGDTP